MIFIQELKENENSQRLPSHKPAYESGLSVELWINLHRISCILMIKSAIQSIVIENEGSLIPQIWEEQNRNEAIKI